MLLKCMVIFLGSLSFLSAGTCAAMGGGKQKNNVLTGIPGAVFPPSPTRSSPVRKLQETPNSDLLAEIQRAHGDGYRFTRR